MPKGKTNENEISDIFADTSLVFSSTAQVKGTVMDHDVANGSSNDFLTITGDDDASGGKGSYLIFVFNGSKWHVEGEVFGTGTGADAAVNVAFSDT